MVKSSSRLSGTTGLIRRSPPTAIYLRGRLLSAAKMVRDRRVTRSSHRSCPNLSHLRKTDECRNTQRRSESDLRTESCAVHPLSRPSLYAAPIPIAHKAHQRFAGNRCSDNPPMPTADSSTRIVSRRKRIHQSTPFFTFGTRRNAFHSAATQLLTLAAFRKFWQRLVKGDPRQFIFEPDRFLRRKRRGIIERRDRHIDGF